MTMRPDRARPLVPAWLDLCLDVAVLVAVLGAARGNASDALMLLVLMVSFGGAAAVRCFVRSRSRARRPTTDRTIRPQRRD